jgi:hypothetical protein
MDNIVKDGEVRWRGEPLPGAEPHIDLSFRLPYAN